MTEDRRRERTLWAAWRVAPDGSLEVAATLETGEGIDRQRWEYPSLAAAAEELGESFRDVVERALGEGHTRGRWRP